MPILRTVFIFLKQNTSSPIASSLISLLYLAASPSSKPARPSVALKENYSGKLVEYNCESALNEARDLADCMPKARGDVLSILKRGDERTFLYVKNSQLLGAWQGVPRRMKGQVHFDNEQPGAWFGAVIILLGALALGFQAARAWEESGWSAVLFSAAFSLLAFLIPIVALKGVEDRIVDAQENQTELEFSSHSMRMDRYLDHLENIVDRHTKEHSPSGEGVRDDVTLHEENSEFVERMLQKFSDAFDDINQISLLAPNNACSERALRLQHRAERLKIAVEKI